MIKVMNLVSLLILPAVISLRHNTGARLGIAAASLVVLLAALAFSKRGSEAMDSDASDSTPVAATAAAAASVD
jgi:K(+)-stimulated pyrophosphate-energized sodium pump